MLPQTGPDIRKHYLSERMFMHLRRKFHVLDDATLLLQIEEFLKFILLCRLASPGRLPVSTEIDEIWHTWILETPEYQKLCEAAVGRFIHHESTADTPKQDLYLSDKDLEQDLYFVVAYIRNFGPLISSSLRYWPAASRLMVHLQVTLSELNDLGQQLCNSADSAQILLP